MPINGEAIFGTRPWHTFGEGPNLAAAGHFKEDETGHTAEDIRFTTKGDSLYAIILGWPPEGKTTVKSLAEGTEPTAINSVGLLGHDGELTWNRDSSGLHVSLPEKAPCDHAVVLRIQ